MKLNINDEQGIELLYFIFERELKPPFTFKEERGELVKYYNRVGEFIAWSYAHSLGERIDLRLIRDPYVENIRHKVCQTFGFDPYDNDEYWWFVSGPYIRTWLENQINVKLDDIYL